MANNGIKGKFRDRLRLIVVNRYKKIKGIVNKNKENIKDDENVIGENNERFIVDRVSYIRKRLSEDREKDLEKGVIVKKKRMAIGKVADVKDVSFVNNENNVDSKFEGKDSDNYRESSKDNFDYDNNRVRRNFKRKRIGIGKDNRDIEKVEEEKIKDNLKVKIIKKIRNRLDNSVNEIEVLESELYFLEEDNNKELELEKIRQIKNKISDVIKKIENIKKEYEIFKNNYYLEDVVDLEDKFLLDDILDYKYLLNNLDANKELVNEYKLLEEYKDLYDKIEDIECVREKLVRENNAKTINYDERDKKYKIICDKFFKIDDIKKSVNYEIDKQNKYLNELLSKISKIDKNEYTIYKVKGLGEVIGNSLKYVGLMMISPFLGFLPGIAASTIATRKMVKNAREKMRLEEVNKVNYIAEDFNSEINNRLCDINYVYYVIDDTLNEINGLKKDFLVQYNSRINGYKETLDNINKVEKIIINNRKKVDIIKKRMLESKKINEDKMIRVKKLNENS